MQALNLQIDGHFSPCVTAKGDDPTKLAAQLPPGYAPAAFVLLAELHGCIGHFPTLIRLRPKAGPVPAYEVAELLNLQAMREAARTRR